MAELLSFCMLIGFKDHWGLVVEDLGIHLQIQKCVGTCKPQLCTSGRQLVTAFCNVICDIRTEVFIDLEIEF